MGKKRGKIRNKVYTAMWALKPCLCAMRNRRDEIRFINRNIAKDVSHQHMSSNYYIQQTTFYF